MIGISRPAFAHQVDQRGGLAFEALLAPINHHAADRRVGLHGDLGVLEASRLDDLEAHPFDGGDDLVDPKALQIVGVEHRRREQEGEPLEEVHVGAPRRLEFVRAFRAGQPPALLRQQLHDRTMTGMTSPTVERGKQTRC